LLNNWDSGNVFFVVRHKDNIRYRSIEELPLPEKHAQEVLIDEIIEFELLAAKSKYPKCLRRIAVWNDERGFEIELLTNNFILAASSMAALYKARWNDLAYKPNLTPRLGVFFRMSLNFAFAVGLYTESADCAWRD